MNEIVKYKNALNQLRFTKFNKVDSRLFFTLCAELKEKDTDIVTLPFDKIRNLSNFNRNSSWDVFANALEGMYSRLLASNVTLRYVDEESGPLEIIEKFNIFHAYKINPNEQTAKIQVSEFFRTMLNDWDGGGWTRFELEEYTGLKSEYSQAMFRLLKQWRTQGGFEWEITEWRRLLGVPDGYRMQDINRRILQPIQNELSLLFGNLKIEKLTGGKGRTITHLKFSFVPEVVPEKEEPKDTKTKEEKLANIEQQRSDNGGEFKSAAQAATYDNIKSEQSFIEKLKSLWKR